MTVRELREVLAAYPDDAPVRFSSGDPDDFAETKRVTALPVRRVRWNGHTAWEAAACEPAEREGVLLETAGHAAETARLTREHDRACAEAVSAAEELSRTMRRLELDAAIRGALLESALDTLAKAAADAHVEVAISPNAVADGWSVRVYHGGAEMCVTWGREPLDAARAAVEWLAVAGAREDATSR